MSARLVGGTELDVVFAAAVDDAGLAAGFAAGFAVFAAAAGFVAFGVCLDGGFAADGAAFDFGGVSLITSASSIGALVSLAAFPDVSEGFAFGSEAFSFFVDFGASAIIHLPNLYTRPLARPPSQT